MDQNCDLLNRTDKLFNKLKELESKLSKSEYINDEIFNEMIVILVNCIDKIHLFNNMNAEFYIEKISDNIVKVIELVNNGMESKIRPYISNSIIILSYLRKLILNLEKKNIIIIGINEYSKYMNDIIDFNKANILAYVSMNNITSNLNSEFIISKEEINQFDVDYYILMDEVPSNIDLDSKQIIRLWKYLKIVYFQGPEYSVRFSDYMLSEKDYDGIITGLSYTELGIDENILINNFVNLANPAQDLFYEFEMFKYGLEQSDNKYNIKYSIIGLCLYSFDYDLSLSVNNHPPYIIIP